MKYVPIIVLISLIMSILSCKGASPKKPQQNDPFYADSGEGKFLVIPLIKPYRIATYEGVSDGWQMDLYETYPDILHIEKIAVEKKLIMVFAPTNPRTFPTDPVWHWVAIIPGQKSEKGFKNEDEFLSYIQKFGIETPNWVEPLEAFQQFEKSGCLSWIPNCE